jgi:hypothetical protein
MSAIPPTTTRATAAAALAAAGNSPAQTDAIIAAAAKPANGATFLTSPDFAAPQSEPLDEAALATEDVSIKASVSSADWGLSEDPIPQTTADDEARVQTELLERSIALERADNEVLRITKDIEQVSEEEKVKLKKELELKKDVAARAKAEKEKFAKHAPSTPRVYEPRVTPNDEQKLVLATLKEAVVTTQKALSSVAKGSPADKEIHAFHLATRKYYEELNRFWCERGNDCVDGKCTRHPKEFFEQYKAVKVVLKPLLADKVRLLKAAGLFHDISRPIKMNRREAPSTPVRVAFNTIAAPMAVLIEEFPELCMGVVGRIFTGVFHPRGQKPPSYGLSAKYLAQLKSSYATSQRSASTVVKKALEKAKTAAIAEAAKAKEAVLAAEQLAIATRTAANKQAAENAAQVAASVSASNAALMTAAAAASAAAVGPVAAGTSRRKLKE